VWIAVVLDFFKPIFDMVESITPTVYSLLPRNVVNKKSTDGTSIVRTGDGAEVFLTCSIPDLELDIFVVDRDSLSSKFDSDGHIVSDSGLVLDELEYDTRFSNS
jgi:hypothetical protein